MRWAYSVGEAKGVRTSIGTMSSERGSVDGTDVGPTTPVDGGGEPSALSRDEVFDIPSNQR